MEERLSWRSALGTAWRNLTGVNDEGNIRTVRWLFFIIFMMGTAWAVWNYMQAQQLMELGSFSATPVPNVADADRQRLDAMIQQVESASRLRTGSPEAVDILMLAGWQKYPFGEPKFPAELPPAEDGLSVPVVVIDYPPEGINLRGIMIVGKDNVAVMDIPGVGTGMIVRAGDTFMQRKGRVVRIAPDKVVINWGGKNWDIAPSF